MKHLSLQWRITLITMFLTAISCLIMNYLFYGSGSYYIESVGKFFADTNLEVEFVEENESFDSKEFEDSGEVMFVITTAKE